MAKYLLIAMTILSFSLSCFALDTKLDVVPRVKKSLINYCLKDGAIKEAYSKIKVIGLDAIEFVQSGGKSSSQELNEAVLTVSRELEHEAIFLTQDQIVATIISAINS